MNTTTLYVNVCRLVMQSSLDENSASDLFKAITCLRQALACTVCSNLLMEPFSPSDTSCQHHVCRACVGEKKKLKPSCSWCKDYSKYAENVGLRTTLQCYKKVCVYVTKSTIWRNLVALSSSGVTPLADHTKIIIDIVKEGAGFKDEFNPTNINSLPVNQNFFCDATTQTVDGDGPENNQPSISNGIYSCIYTGTGNRITIKRENADSLDEKMSRFSKLRKKSAFGLMETRCKCGQQMNPSRGTCKGYKCPCYSVDRPCYECSCHGCNNPTGVNPKDNWPDYLAGVLTSSDGKLDQPELSSPEAPVNPS